MKEIWKDIPGYEGKYQASTFGNIRSLNYRGNTGIIRNLKPSLCNTSGYYRVDLYDTNFVPRHKLVHVLIADTFLPNKESLPCVNHKDENKTNNKLSNLERCTYQYNSNYGTSKERIKKKLKNIKGLTNKAVAARIKGVNQYTTDGILVATFDSVSEAARIIGLKNNSGIVLCCKGKQKTAKGYIWKYRENPEELK